MVLHNIGSDSWHSVLSNLDNTAMDVLVKRCIEDTKWNNILEMCTNLRKSVRCKLSDKFSCGTQHLVRLIEFDDHVKWVVRIRFQEPDYRNAEEAMNSQVATYKFLKEQTEVPVPEVHAFRAFPNDEVGPPFMILTYLHGSVADSCNLDDEQTRYVFKQMAQMFVNLSRHKFDRIGSMFLKENGEIEIRKDIDIDDGPFATAQEYYDALSTFHFHHFADKCFLTNLDASSQSGILLPLLFRKIMPILTDCANESGPFSLVNVDAGFHNVLIDENLDIVGVIDCDSFMAAPIHVVAQPPSFCGIQYTPPGLVTNKPLAKITYDQGETRFNEYVEMVEGMEKLVDAECPIANAMRSDGAKLVDGIISYYSRQDWINTEWSRAFWYMYFRATKGESRALTYSDAYIPDDSDDEDGDDTEEVKEDDTGEEEREEGVCKQVDFEAEDVEEDVEELTCKGAEITEGRKVISKQTGEVASSDDETDDWKSIQEQGGEMATVDDKTDCWKCIQEQAGKMAISDDESEGQKCTGEQAGGMAISDDESEGQKCTGEQAGEMAISDDESEGRKCTGEQAGKMAISDDESEGRTCTGEQVRGMATIDDEVEDQKHIQEQLGKVAITDDDDTEAVLE